MARETRGLPGSLPPAPPVRRILALVSTQLRPLALVALLVVIESGLGLVAPRIAGMVVDSAVLVHDLHRLDVVVVILVGVFAGRAALSYVEQYQRRAVSARILRRLRDLVYSNLVSFGPDFFERRRVGELVSRIGSDLEKIESMITHRIPDGLRAAITFAGTLAILFCMQARLTVLTLMVLPPVGAIALWYGRRLQRLAFSVQEALADSTAAAEETLSGIRTVQAFRAEEHARRRYRSALERLLSLELDNARLVGVSLGLFQFIGFGAFAAVLWYGGRIVAHGGGLTPGDLTAFLIYTYAIASSVGSLGGLYTGARELRGASARVFEILDTEPSIRDPASPVAAPARWRGALSLTDVGFQYPSSPRWAVRGVTVEARPGETVAIVGPSGAGKSTLFSLLLRFYDPGEGTITLDGRDLRALPLRTLRAAFAVVPQEIFLFGGTVEENIRCGSDRTRDEVREAARRAGAAAFIEALPRGYDERVGVRGIKLSAGQRQRLAIARALLRDPAVLLLDEATSALDAESDAAVQDGLGELMRERTTLVIAHRLSTARRADRIAVLEAGRIVGIGSHRELYRTNDLYRRYWDLQARGAPQPGGGAPDPAGDA